MARWRNIKRADEVVTGMKREVPERALRSEEERGMRVRSSEGGDAEG